MSSPSFVNVASFLCEPLEARRLLTAIVDPRLETLAAEYADYLEEDEQERGIFSPSDNTIVVDNGDRVEVTLFTNPELEAYSSYYDTIVEIMGFQGAPGWWPANQYAFVGTLPISSLGNDLYETQAIEQIDAEDAPTSPGGADAIATSLLQLEADYADYLDNPVGSFTPDPDLHAMIAGSDVMITVQVSGAASSVLTALQLLGLDNELVGDHTITGTLPMTEILSLPSISGFRGADLVSSQTNAGSVQTQGDAAIKANLARQHFPGVTGAGVKIGVISDSFNRFGEYADDIASGDLPNNVQVLNDVGALFEGSLDEGRAMLQIIHDVAPGASLAFASGKQGMLGFVNAVNLLRAAGCKIIVDDLWYRDDPMLQDGIAAQAVDAATNAGVAFFSAAGNFGSQGYEKNFFPGHRLAVDAFPRVGRKAPRFRGGYPHLFNGATGGVDRFQQFTLQDGESISLVVNWDQPFKTGGGTENAEGDLDVYVFDHAGLNVIGGASKVSKEADPFEEFTYTNTTGVTKSFNLMICRRYTVGFLKYVDTAKDFNNGYLGSNKFDEYATNSGTVWGHMNSSGAIAVAAAPHNGTTTVEPFSSRGKTAIRFSSSGVRLNPIPAARQKPVVTGPDGVYTTVPFFDSVHPFFGTSAAAPHAAAAAALMIQGATGGTLTPGQIGTNLATTAIDIESAGIDVKSGYGFINADAATARGRVTGGGHTNWFDVTATDSATEIIIGLLNTGGVTGVTVSFDDVEFALPGAEQIAIYGGDGADVITVDADVTITIEIYGNDGNDTITGGGGTNLLNGGAGDDIIYSRSTTATDTLFGGLGSDTATVQTLDDLLDDFEILL